MKTPSLPLRLPSTLPADMPPEWPDFPMGKWPRDLLYPKFSSWRATGKASAVRNLVALLLLELGLSRDEVANFLELSPSRTLAIARAMRVKLFGKEFAKYEEDLEKSIAMAGTFRNAAHLVQHSIDKKNRWPLVKRQAILYAMNSLASDYHDYQLWHATLELLARREIEFNPVAVANEA